MAVSLGYLKENVRAFGKDRHSARALKAARRLKSKEGSCPSSRSGLSQRNARSLLGFFFRGDLSKCGLVTVRSFKIQKNQICFNISCFVVVKYPPVTRKNSVVEDLVKNKSSN